MPSRDYRNWGSRQSTAPRATGTEGNAQAPKRLALCLARTGSESRDPVRRGAAEGVVSAGGPGDEENQKSARTSGKTAEKNGGSAWESNPPTACFAYGPTVLKTADDSQQSQTAKQVREEASEDLAHCLALRSKESPDLVLVAAAWPDLPEAIRVAMVAMVKAARGHEHERIAQSHDPRADEGRSEIVLGPSGCRDSGRKL